MRGHVIGTLLFLVGALPATAGAQQFSFGFATGGGHHHGHHHHGCYDGWYGFEIYRPRYVYPPPVVYAPPPVTYVYPAPAVQVVQPAVPALTQSAPTASPIASQATSNSAVRLNSLPASRERSDVVLRNPTANAGSVAFRVQDQVDAELGPGMTRTWSDRTSLTVEFDRGGDFGAARKILRPGAYEFVVTDEGWDLVAAVAPSANRSAGLQRNSLPRK